MKNPALDLQRLTTPTRGQHVKDVSSSSSGSISGINNSSFSIFCG